MTSQIDVISIRPAADETEVIVISAALVASWPKLTERLRVLRDPSWRFSGRAHRGHVVRAPKS